MKTCNCGRTHFARYTQCVRCYFAEAAAYLEEHRRARARRGK